MKSALCWAAVFLFAVWTAGCDNSDGDAFEEPEIAADDDDADEAPTDDVIATVTALADSWMGFHNPERLAWSWDAAVLMMGLWELDRVVGDGRYRRYVKAWLDHHIEEGYVVATSDTAVPGYIAMLAYEEWGDEAYREVGDVVWDYIENKAARTDDGGLNHLGWTTGRQLWIDSLFMFGPFLMRYAKVIGDDAPAVEYAHQLEIFRTHLRDEDAKLYRHRYDGDTGEVSPEAPLFWGRGNGWVFVAENIAATELPADVRAGMGFDLDQDLVEMYEAIKAADTETGRFHTLINEPSTYLETSAGLLFAYGAAIGTRSGLFDEGDVTSRVEHWLDGALQQIVTDAAQDTLLLGTSYGTSPGDVDYYDQVLKGENVSYGIGVFLLAAVGRQDVGPATTLERPGFWSGGEAYIDHPIPCRETVCGKFYMARGHFDRAREKFDETRANNPNEAEANFYDGLIDIIRFGEEVVAELDKQYVGLTDTAGIIDWFVAQVPTLQSVAARMAIAEADPAFTSISERVLLIESGGHTAVGHVEFDTGEAYLLDGVGHVLAGGLRLIGGLRDFVVPKSLADVESLLRAGAFTMRAAGNMSEADDAIDEMIAGIDKLIAGIDSIMAETDDQSDDFIPQNLLRLEGTWGIPGILEEQPVQDILGGLGLPADRMPQYLIDLLETLKSILSALKILL